MQQKQTSFISRFIRGRYFKIKFKLAVARNSITTGVAEETGGFFLKIIKKIYIFFYAICLNLLAQLILLFAEQRESFDILKEDLQDKNNKRITMAIDVQEINLEQLAEKIKNNQQIENKDQVIQELIEKLFQLHKQRQKKTTVFSLAGLSAITIASIAISLIVTIIMPAVRQSKAAANGVIDQTYKYAWNENAGWINFGTESGNVHVTDSALSGSALSETSGWINLDNVTNDGEGNLSGYGWGENVGWVNFAPANGGVVINSSGEFTGSALGENIGWIIFSGDYTVKTDWRPQSSRPACDNALDDDGDGLIDYSNDAGCESLTDDDETNPGGLPLAALNPPTPPTEPPTADNPTGGFNVSINNGDEYTNKREIELKLFAGTDTKQFAVSQYPDFQNAALQPYQPNNEGFQIINFKLQDSISQIPDSNFQVFAKFYTQYGQPSDVVSDTIILKEEAATADEKAVETISSEAKEFAEQIVSIAAEAVELVKLNTENQQHALTDFIEYGTATTQRLGSGERAGVVNSYKSTYGKLPETQDEWSDVLKIANGRWPKEISETAEAKAVATFKKIYLRNPNRTNPNDDAAIMIMAYGLRPANRNLDSEKAAIKIFINIYKYSPASASDWDAARAVAYSGARR